MPSKSSGPPPQVDKAPGEVALDRGEILMGELENCSDVGVKTREALNMCESLFFTLLIRLLISSRRLKGSRYDLVIFFLL